ncbi:hypothetical protein DFH07DRAFT_773484 [Mycena maculata]|uniref:Uncharacterized protein n=1 Tax=Mycena maculata TaxID=230809 RepID=A0AAD7NCU1_9AGAR|nr:hypothetical protein DFH07DRAFT_773484 [Mycena maculata]
MLSVLRLWVPEYCLSRTEHRDPKSAASVPARRHPLRFLDREGRPRKSAQPRAHPPRRARVHPGPARRPGYSTAPLDNLADALSYFEALAGVLCCAGVGPERLARLFRNFAMLHRAESELGTQAWDARACSELLRDAAEAVHEILVVGKGAVTAETAAEIIRVVVDAFVAVCDLQLDLLADVEERANQLDETIVDGL